MDNKEKVLKKFEELNIFFSIVEHPAVFTIDQMDELDIDAKKDIVKNLFLRDASGKRHFLVVVSKDKKVDLKKLKEKLNSSSLSFASEERLEKYLNLTKGSVSPLGIINDPTKSVEVAFDKDLMDKEKIGVHPNDNRATVFLSFKDLNGLVEANGNKIYYVDI